MARRRNLAEMEDRELLGMLDETKDELLNLKFQNATGQLDNMNMLKQTRRQVARIHTELRVREIQEAERSPSSEGEPSSERAADDRSDPPEESQAAEDEQRKKPRKDKSKRNA